MKRILLFLLLVCSINYAQTSGRLLLMFGDDVWKITITSSANPTITMRGTGQIIIDWNNGKDYFGNPFLGKGGAVQQ